MPIYSLNSVGGSPVKIAEINALQVSGASAGVIKEVYGLDTTGVIKTLVFTRRKYLVKDGTPIVGWSRGVAEFYGEPAPNVTEVSGVTTGYGFSKVQSVAGSASDKVYVAGLATNQLVTFVGFSKIVFEFNTWARDENRESGYFKTCAGIFSDRKVARGGGMDESIAPTSLLAGWVANGIKGGIQSWGFPLKNNIKSGYIGLSSGGGFYGNGHITVKNIYLA